MQAGAQETYENARLANEDLNGHLPTGTDLRTWKRHPATTAPPAMTPLLRALAGEGFQHVFYLPLAATPKRYAAARTALNAGNFAPPAAWRVSILPKWMNTSIRKVPVPGP